MIELPQKAIIISLNLTEHSLNNLLQKQLGNIPIYRLKKAEKIVYHAVTSHPREIPEISPSQIEFPQVQFRVNQLESGKQKYQLEDHSLEIWLQQLPTWKIPPQTYYHQNYNFFPLQYAHSRCCSLLRLGEQEGLIKLKNLEFQEWCWLQPDPLPWLQPFTQRDYNLIHQFFNLVEVTPNTNAEYWFKLALNLAEAMLELHRYARIWGEITKDNRALAQARLGLIALTQFFLRQLLAQKFGILSPVNL